MKPRSIILSLCFGLLGSLGGASLQAQPPGPAGNRPIPQPVLVAPVQLTPPMCGEILHNFPRTLNLKWLPVANADYYVVDIDCFDAHQSGHWDSEFNLDFKGGIAATALTYNGFPGDNKGRWRVQAVKRGPPTTPLIEGPWSKWCDLSFQTAPQPKPPKPPQPPVIRISRIDCGDVTGNPLGVRIAISILSPSGGSQWHVWSTWGGSNHSDKTYTGTLPTSINEVVSLVHYGPDSVNRAHQWGLSVTVPGFDKPFRVYEFEPGADKRCPGHYLPAQTTPDAAKRLK